MGKTFLWEQIYDWASKHCDSSNWWIKVTGELSIQGGHLPVETTMKAFTPEPADNFVIIRATTLHIISRAV